MTDLQLDTTYIARVGSSYVDGRVTVWSPAVTFRTVTPRPPTVTPTDHRRKKDRKGEEHLNLSYYFRSSYGLSWTAAFPYSDVYDVKVSVNGTENIVRTRGQSHSVKFVHEQDSALRVAQRVQVRAVYSDTIGCGPWSEELLLH